MCLFWYRNIKDGHETFIWSPLFEPYTFGSPLRPRNLLIPGQLWCLGQQCWGVNPEGPLLVFSHLPGHMIGIGLSPLINIAERDDNHQRCQELYLRIYLSILNGLWVQVFYSRNKHLPVTWRDNLDGGNLLFFSFVLVAASLLDISIGIPLSIDLVVFCFLRFLEVTVS